jgi:hypothetical protein
MSDNHEDYKGVHLTFIEQYSQFFKRCNWYTYNGCNVEIDNDKFTGSMDATVIILGLGFRITYNYALNDNIKHILKKIENIKEQYKEPKP